MVGQIIGGEFGEIHIRKRSEEHMDIGELLVADNVVLQVFDMNYESLIESRDLARMSGMFLENYGEMNIKEANLRNFTVVRAKPVFDLGTQSLPKRLPRFFQRVRRIEDRDFEFMRHASGDLYLGRVRSGTRVLNIPVNLNAQEVLSHHMLVAATTGRGKSNFMKVMLWNLVGNNRVGILVLDAHNEYYSYAQGNREYGLSRHPDARDNVYLYSPNPVHGAYSLRINIRAVRPSHLREIVEFTSAQEDAMSLALRTWGNEWIEMILSGASLGNVHETTLAALQRKIQVALDLSYENSRVVAHGPIFSTGPEGQSTIEDIVTHLDEGKIVILDTGSISGSMEIVISSMIMTRIFERHKRCKEGRTDNCVFDELPVVSVVLEEAPRVLGGDRGNIFKTIAREGRKFRVGLIAITQLPSMIPREIMANLNTKYILGNETRSERDALISTAAQDLSKDSKLIASLERGEALITSVFTRFAIPVAIDRFEDVVERAEETARNDRSGAAGESEDGEESERARDRIVPLF